MQIQQEIIVCFAHSQMMQFFPKALTGVFELKVFRAPPLTPFTPPPTYIAARCDMETDGGGWMVIQRRVANGTVNFTRDWDDYACGFGDMDGEFWYGLDNIHYLTTRDDVELRIDMVMEDDGSELTWTYQTFTVAGPDEEYRLTIDRGQGAGVDAMAYHNGQRYSTYDNDNDQASKNCAYSHQGGWWYNDCYRANLNGPHELPSTPGVSSTYARLIWNDGSFRDVSSSEMKIRVKDCSC